MSIAKEWNVRCPDCKSDQSMQIVVPIWVELYETGTVVVDGDHEWDGSSDCKCTNCDWSGTVDDARADVKRKPKGLPERVSFGGYFGDYAFVYLGKRRPRQGEFYLSGAVISAWRAPNDLPTPYMIVEAKGPLCLTRKQWVAAHRRGPIYVHN